MTQLDKMLKIIIKKMDKAEKENNMDEYNKYMVVIREIERLQ